MIRASEIDRLDSDLRTINEALERVNFIGEVDVKCVGGNPDGGDLRFTLTYPDWKNIGFKR
jgi:hypothetical protein